VIEKLDSEDMLPAIYFIFSRKGCAEAVKQCLRDGLRLTTPVERDEILALAEARTADLSPIELDILGYNDWISGLERGIAAHHAGMIPPFKEVVEELFSRGLVKAVFATETLALGINMPARSVVIESLMKFTGEKHELVTPGQFTQLCGRAGRRGKDEIGHALVLMQRFTPFDSITRLASTRTYPLRSSFQPSYNMAVNLVRNYDLQEAEHLVNSSFAQFQTDRGVVRQEREREKLDAYLASYDERARCDKGDLGEYQNLLKRLRKLQQRTGSRDRAKAVNASVLDLSPGDVIEVRAGKKRGRYAIVEIMQRRSERRPRILALGRQGALVRFGPADLPEPPIRLGRLQLEDRHRVSDPDERAAIAEAVKSFQTPPPEVRTVDTADEDEAKSLRESIARHPVAACQELGRHLHFAERATRLQKEIAVLDRRISRTTGTLARRFDQVLAVLEKMGYVDEWQLTDKGELLTSVYNESDLLVVEALEVGLFDDLEPAEIAAVCSTLVFETRGPDGPRSIDMPTRGCEHAWRTLMRMWRGIRAEEEGRQLDLTREPDPGFATKSYWWSDGRPLEQVLGDDDAPGDFVRSTKQLVDLLRQLSDISGSDPLSDKIDEAVAGLNRGVVAYSSLEL
jgi:ATP-dependent RNA helicase HelY